MENKEAVSQRQLIQEIKSVQHLLRLRFDQGKLTKLYRLIEKLTLPPQSTSGG